MRTRRKGVDFAVGEELGQPRKFELAEELREAVQPDGAEADEEPEHPVQGWGAAFGQAEDEAEEQEAKIDGDITFTQRDFVAHVFITNKLAGYQTVDALRIAQIFRFVMSSKVLMPLSPASSSG